MPFLKGKNLVGLLEVTGVEGYVIAQHFFKGCMVLGIPAAVLFSMGAVAGEVHRGSLEIWLARPLSRNRILVERWVQGALAVVIPVFATSLTIPWLLSFVDEMVRRLSGASPEEDAADAVLLRSIEQSQASGPRGMPCESVPTPPAVQAIV